MGLPFCQYYNADAQNIRAVGWFNGDYFFYIVRHFLPNFSFYFEVQHDCFLNGDYEAFFGHFDGDLTDAFLSYFRREKEDSKWCWTRDTAWILEPNEWHGCLWVFQRFSALAVDKFLIERQRQGEIFKKIDQNAQKSQWLLCEIFCASFAIKWGLSVKTTPQNACGIAEFDLNNRRLFLWPDNKMYHSVKGNFLGRLGAKNREVAGLRGDLAAVKIERDNLGRDLAKLRGELATARGEINSQKFIKNSVKIGILRQKENLAKLAVFEKEKALGVKISALEPRVNLILGADLWSSAVSRVRNHLAYKLGAAVIAARRSFWGILFLPVILYFVKISHKMEAEKYAKFVAKNPTKKFPPLEKYADFDVALREKNCFTYKLGEAFIKGAKSWYKGGLVRFYFQAKKLEREFKKAKNSKI